MCTFNEVIGNASECIGSTPSSSNDDSAEAEVFNKTLAFFCAITERGCSFDVDLHGAHIDSLDFNSESRTTHESCDAPLAMSVNDLGRPYVQ